MSIPFVIFFSESAGRSRNDGLRRQRSAADEVATFDEQRKLARREPHHRRRLRPPKLSEPPALETLREQAKTRAIPEQHLASLARSRDEQIQIAAERITRESDLHQPVEPVVALAQVDGFRVRVNAYRPARSEDHRSV